MTIPKPGHFMVPILLRWVGLLLLAGALVLQSVGSAIYEEGTASRSPVSLLWLMGPVVGWVVGPWLTLRHPSRRGSLGLEYVWMILLGLHAVRAGILGGATEGLVSFLSWGAWFGVYLWLCAASPLRTWIRRSFLWLYMLIGFTLALGVIFEAVTGITLTKETTVAEDLVRRYGLSQSVVVGGIQIGCGLIACIYQSLTVRSAMKRLLITSFAAVQWLGLFLCAARAPILLSLTAVLSLLGIAAFRKVSSLQFQAALLGIMAVAAVPVVLRQGWLNEGIIEYLKSSLTVGDSSNMVRIERMKETISEATVDAATAMVGLGSGETVVLLRLRGFETMTSESSALKLWLELGAVGAVIFYGMVGAILARSVRCQTLLAAVTQEHRDMAMRHLCLVAIVLILLVQTMFHDMLTTWAISGMFWSALGLLEGANAELLHSAGFSETGARFMTRQAAARAQ